MPTARVPRSPVRALLAGLGALGLHVTAQPAPIDGEVIVQLRQGADIGPLLVKHQLSLVARFGNRPIYRLMAAGRAPLKERIEALRDEPDVRSVEPNQGHELPRARKNVPWTIGERGAFVEQWAVQAIRLPQAQQVSTGAGVRVAVLDTGVDIRHPAFAGRLLPGFDFVDYDTDPSEAGTEADYGYGHGTHVAGLVSLVAPDARIMPLRILDAQGYGNAWVLAEAMLYAVDPDGDPRTDDGAHVINLSVGTLAKTKLFKTITKLVACKKGARTASPDPDDDDSDDDGLDDVASPDDKLRCQGLGGAVVVAAAGNRGSSTVREYPAGETAHALLSVAASARGGWLAQFSNYGWVKMAAPGDGITSAVPGGGYATWSGTSMAAPLAAGAAALLRAADRSLPPDRVVKRLRDRGFKLCGTNMRQLDVAAALADAPAGSRPSCGSDVP